MKIHKKLSSKTFLYLFKATLHHICGVCECFVFLLIMVFYFSKQWRVQVQFMQANPRHETCSQFTTQNFTFC